MKTVLAAVLAAAALGAATPAKAQGAGPKSAPPPAAPAPGKAAPAPESPAKPVEPIDYPAPDLLTDAGRARLEAERLGMRREFERNAVWDPERIKKAVEAMDAGAANTVQDNVARFARALAALHDPFARAWALVQERKYGEAAEYMMEDRKLLKEVVRLIKARFQHNTMPPYAYGLTRMLHAECCGRVGQLSDMIIGYQVVYEKLPDNLTFSAAARLRTARIYEETGRAHFAIPIYRQLADRYGAFLTDTEVFRLVRKAAELERIDPYRAGALGSAESAARLARGETGPIVQATQKALIGQLNAMLALAEEEQRPFLEHTDTIALAGEKSLLRDGAPPGRLLTPTDVSLSGSDDWGRLRPREKQQLLQLFNETYPQRYRDMLEAYYKTLSDAETEAARKSK
jgi:hypothetical protein